MNGPPSGLAPTWLQARRTARARPARDSSSSGSPSMPIQVTRASYGVGEGAATPDAQRDGPAARDRLGDPLDQRVDQPARDVGHEGRGDVPEAGVGPAQVGPGVAARVEELREVVQGRLGRDDGGEDAHRPILSGRLRRGGVWIRLAPGGRGPMQLSVAATSTGPATHLVRDRAAARGGGRSVGRPRPAVQSWQIFQSTRRRSTRRASRRRRTTVPRPGRPCSPCTASASARRPSAASSPACCSWRSWPCCTSPSRSATRRLLRGRSRRLGRGRPAQPGRRARDRGGAGPRRPQRARRRRGDLDNGGPGFTELVLDGLDRPGASACSSWRCAALWWLRLPVEFDAPDEEPRRRRRGAAALAPAPAPDANVDDLTLDGVELIEPVERLQPREAERRLDRQRLRRLLPALLGPAPAPPSVGQAHSDLAESR